MTVAETPLAPYLSLTRRREGRPQPDGGRYHPGPTGGMDRGPTDPDIPASRRRQRPDGEDPMGSSSDPDRSAPHASVTQTTDSIRVSMFLTDWLGLSVWLRYQRQSALREAAALAAREAIVSRFPPAWQTMTLADHLHDVIGLDLPEHVRPFLLEFGGDGPMAQATRVRLDGEPVPPFHGRRHLA